MTTGGGVEVGRGVRAGRGVRVRVGVAVGVRVGLGVGVGVAVGASPCPALSGSDESPTLWLESELAALVSAAARKRPATAATAIARFRRQPVIGHFLPGRGSVQWVRRRRRAAA